MFTGNRAYSPLSDGPKQSARGSGGEQDRTPANMGEIEQYQTSELGDGGSNPSRCATVRSCPPTIGKCFNRHSVAATGCRALAPLALRCAPASKKATPAQ